MNEPLDRNDLKNVKALLDLFAKYGNMHDLDPERQLDFFIEGIMILDGAAAEHLSEIGVLESIFTLGFISGISQSISSTERKALTECAADA